MRIEIYRMRNQFKDSPIDDVLPWYNATITHTQLANEQRCNGTIRMKDFPPPFHRCLARQQQSPHTTLIRYACNAIYTYTHYTQTCTQTHTCRQHTLHRLTNESIIVDTHIQTMSESVSRLMSGQADGKSIGWRTRSIRSIRNGRRWIGLSTH